MRYLRVPTARLNEVLQAAIRHHDPGLMRHKALKNLLCDTGASQSAHLCLFSSMIPRQCTFPTSATWRIVCAKNLVFVVPLFVCNSGRVGKDDRLETLRH